MRKIAEPEICEDLPTNVRFGRIGKREAATITLNIQSAIAHGDEMGAALLSLGRCQVPLGQGIYHRGTDIQLDVNRHFPKILAFKESLHAVRHKLAVLAP